MNATHVLFYNLYISFALRNDKRFLCDSKNIVYIIYIILSRYSKIYLVKTGFNVTIKPFRETLRFEKQVKCHRNAFLSLKRN